MIDRLINFLKDSKAELKRVTWPTRQETTKYTMTVIIVSAAVAIFLGSLDYLFQYFLNRFIL